MWAWIKRNGECLPALVETPGQRMVMDFGEDRQFYPCEGSAPGPEDAALIAAAPLLLRACKRALLLPMEVAAAGLGTEEQSERALATIAAITEELVQAIRAAQEKVDLG